MYKGSKIQPGSKNNVFLDLYWLTKVFVNIFLSTVDGLQSPGIWNE